MSFRLHATQLIVFRSIPDTSVLYLYTHVRRNLCYLKIRFYQTCAGYLHIG